MSVAITKLLFRTTTTGRLLVPTALEQRSVSSLARSSVFIKDVCDTKVSQTQQQLRWRHASKIGHMKETLDELAHRPEREAAQERRQKKKEKSAVKRTTGDETPEPSGPSVASAHMTDDTDDDLDFSDDHDDHDDDHEDDEEAEPTLPDLGKVKARMTGVVDRFQESLKAIRGAEPTAEIFDEIQVMAYGSPTPLKAVGQVVIVSPTLAQITCFDPSVAKDVQKAILLSLDQLNPQLDEGGTIKVPLPRPSMEVREQTSKQLKRKAEATKQKIRQVRRKAMDRVKQGKDGKLTGISKDDAFAAGKEIDTLTENVTQRLQKLVDDKLNAIMGM